MSAHSDEYLEYLASPQWAAIRLAVITELEGRCERCGQAAHLEVHHLTYDRLGCERRDDLEGLCSSCHRVADDERRDTQKRRQWKRRLEGYAEKRYGDTTYFESEDWERVEDEFQSWLESKDIA